MLAPIPLSAIGASPSPLSAGLAAALGRVLPASIPSPSRGVWHLGPFPVRAYALCMLAAIFVAVWWTDRRYRDAGGPRDTVVDVALVAVPVGFVCARLYHVITSPDAYFGPNGDLALIPQVWHGGLGVWGGVAGGVAAGAWLLHRRGLRLGAFADAVAPALLLAQAIGRFGNWFNQELFGGPTTLPWGLEIDDAHLPLGYASGTLFHPTFLYEALWDSLGALVLLWLGRRLHRPGHDGGRPGVSGGRLLWAYLVVYTLGRGWIESLRVDDAQIIGGLRLNVWTSLLILAVGVVGFTVASHRPLTDEIWRDPAARDAAEPAQGSTGTITPVNSGETEAKPADDTLLSDKTP